MKTLLKIVVVIAVFLGVAVTASASELIADATVNQNTVTVKFYLDAMPEELENIASVTIKMDYDNTKLVHEKTEPSCDKLARNLQAAKNIIWYASNESSSLTASDMEAVNGLLFTRTFSIADGAYGETEIEYTIIIFTSYSGQRVTDISAENSVINLGDQKLGADYMEILKENSVIVKYINHAEQIYVVEVNHSCLPDDMPSIGLKTDDRFFYLDSKGDIMKYCYASKELPDMNRVIVIPDITPATHIMGDVDNDGDVTALDAQLALKQVVMNTPFFQNDISAYVRADVAGKGEYIITARDAYMIACIARESE